MFTGMHSWSSDSSVATTIVITVTIVIIITLVVRKGPFSPTTIVITVTIVIIITIVVAFATTVVIKFYYNSGCICNH